jgi:hypothetical protein
VSSATGGGATVPTAFSLSGTTVTRQRDGAHGRDGDGDGGGAGHGGQRVHEHGDADAAGGGDEPGQQHGDGAGHGDGADHAEPDQGGGQHTIAVGGTTSFTIVIGNAGPSTLTTASIVDTLPAT